MDREEAENKLYHWGSLLREEAAELTAIGNLLTTIAEDMRSPPIARRRREVFDAAARLDELGKPDWAEKLRDLARTDMRVYRV